MQERSELVGCCNIFFFSRCLQNCTEAAGSWKGEMLRFDLFRKHSFAGFVVVVIFQWNWNKMKKSSAIFISQVPDGLSDLIDGLAHRLKEGTVSENQQLLSGCYFFQGTTWTGSGWNSVEWSGLFCHHQNWVNYTLPACHHYSSFGGSSGGDAIHTQSNNHTARQTTRTYSNQIWGEKYWRRWATLVPEV